MDVDVVFPISVHFDDGEVQEFDNRRELEMTLEFFDSEKEPETVVTDKLGRRVRLKVYELDIKELSLADT